MLFLATKIIFFKMKNNKKIPKAISAKKSQSAKKKVNEISFKKSKDLKQNEKHQKVILFLFVYLLILLVLIKIFFRI